MHIELNIVVGMHLVRITCSYFRLKANRFNDVYVECTSFVMKPIY